MSVLFPWIYIDLTNNTWVFNLNENGNLEYKIMYEEGKWTNEKSVDTGVVAYSIYIEDETINIVYSNRKNELKYCTIKDKQWLGKLLYKIDDNFTVQDLKIEIVENRMHIFYLVKNMVGNDQGILMHCIWDGKEIEIDTIENIILPVDSKEYFKIELDETNNLYVFYVTDEGDGIGLKSRCYVNENWTEPRWLYSVQGKTMDFDVLGNYKKNHILNKWKEGGMYFIEHVAIDEEGNLHNLNIAKSENEIIEPMLFLKDNILYCSWIEDNEIFYSSFNEERWNKKKRANNETNHRVEIYNAFFYSDGHLIKGRKVYVISEPKFEILLYSNLINEDMEKSNKGIEPKYSDEIIKVIEDKEKLQKEIAFINMQLEKKEGLIREYEKDKNNVLNKKDDNIFLQVQKSIQKELDRIKNQLVEEKTNTNNLRIKLKDNDERSALLQEQVNILSEENKRLIDTLELERNKTFINRFLRRKSSDL